MTSIAPWIVDRKLNPNGYCRYLEKSDGTHHIEEPFTRKRYDGTGTRNYIKGGLSPLIGALTNLQHLELTDVMFSGPLPSEIGQLTALTHLSIRSLSQWADFKKITNAMENTIIPTQIGLLTNLETLKIHGDPVPYSLHKINSLDILGDRQYHFGITDNYIDLLNKNFQNITQTFGSYSRWLTSPIQDSFTLWGQLHVRGKIRNSFTSDQCAVQTVAYGEVLDRLGLTTKRTALIDGSTTLTALRNAAPFTYNIYRNPFGKVDGPSGILPTEIGKLVNLTKLSIAHTHLSGTLPLTLNNLEKLTDLQLLNNKFNGSLELYNATSKISDKSDLWLTSTVAYNRFSGCKLGEDDALGNRAYVKFTDSTQETNLQSVTLTSTITVNNQQINAYEIVGKAFIPAGIPQQCFDVNATLVPYCDKTMQGLDITQQTCTFATNATEKEALLQFEKSFLSSQGETTMDSLPKECLKYFNIFDLTVDSSDPLVRKHVYRMSSTQPNVIWPDDTDPCLDSWPGVMCSPEGRVIGLQLSGLNGWRLVGPIPTYIGSFSKLKYLDLSYNLLTSIPTQIGLLTSLKTIDLSFNNISIIPQELINLAKNIDKTSFDDRFISRKAYYQDMVDTLGNNDLAHYIYSKTSYSLWFSSLEGNPINVTQVANLCASRTINCSPLGLGDGTCSSFTIEHALLEVVGFSNENCSLYHSTIETRKAAAAVGDPWKCEICDEKTESLLGSVYFFIVAVAILILLLILLVLFSKYLHPGVLSALKICIAYMQIISVIVLPSVSIPINVRSYLVVFHIFSFKFPDAGIACYTGENTALNRIMGAEPSSVLIFAIVAYLLLLIPTGIMIKLNRCCGRCSDERQEKMKKIKVVHHARRCCCCCMTPETNDKINQDIWDAFVIKAPALVIVPMSSAMTASFVRLMPFAINPDETFWDASKISLISNGNGGVGIILILNAIVCLFIIAYLLTLAYFLHHCDTGHIAPHRAEYLTKDFLPHLYFWVEVEMIIRILMAISSASGINTFAELGLCAFFLFIGFALHLKFRPYREKSVDNFQTASYISQSIILLLTIGWHGIEQQAKDSESPELIAIATGTILLAYLFIALALLRYTFTACREQIKTDEQIVEEKDEKKGIITPTSNI